MFSRGGGHATRHPVEERLCPRAAGVGARDTAVALPGLCHRSAGTPCADPALQPGAEIELEPLLDVARWWRCSCDTPRALGTASGVRGGAGQRLARAGVLDLPSRVSGRLRRARALQARSSNWRGRAPATGSHRTRSEGLENQKSQTFLFRIPQSGVLSTLRAGRAQTFGLMQQCTLA